MKSPLLLASLLAILTFGSIQLSASPIDVIHYQVQIEPDILNRTIIGEEVIEFKALENTQTISFDCGSLQIQQLEIPGTSSSYIIKNRKVQIRLDEALVPSRMYQVKITYTGRPRTGVLFNPDIPSMSTIFSTNQWMVCKTAIDDKATLDLTIIAPKQLTVIASGQMQKEVNRKDGKVAAHWQLRQPVSVYIFGFAIGPFHSTTQVHRNIHFQYLSARYQAKELKQIFVETPNMLDFFEKKAGIPYPDSSYSQILFQGRASQEMANFTVMRGDYGKQVLKDSKAINLAAHELAHQWWGNQVTCEDWTHFWLNEGLAVYMSTAFREHRWGKTAYEADMKVYYDAFQKVVQAGKDKALVFPNWNNPSAEDRVLVYYKGAYVFHLLREKLGDELFWKALKRYTQTYYGKSVISQDLQQVLEEVSGKNLQDFFKEWVYKK